MLIYGYKDAYIMYDTYDTQHTGQAQMLTKKLTIPEVSVLGMSSLV